MQMLDERQGRVDLSQHLVEDISRWATEGITKRIPVCRQRALRVFTFYANNHLDNHILRAPPGLEPPRTRLKGKRGVPIAINQSCETVSDTEQRARWMK